MKTKKHDTSWMVSVALMASDRNRSGEHTAWNDTASDH